MSHAIRLHDGLGTIAEDPSVGILLAYGSTVPTDGTVGYAPGCQFLKTNATTLVTTTYVNIGTKASCNFDSSNGCDIVNVTASSLAVTAAAHANKTVTINAAAGCAVTLPAATGTGNRYRFFIGTTITSNTTTFTRAGSDTMFGMIYQLADGGSTLAAYECPGSTVITLDGSTKGGIKGDMIEFQDMASAVWSILGHTSATGTEATPVT